jgi:hypothetical protein
LHFLKDCVYSNKHHIVEELKVVTEEALGTTDENWLAGTVQSYFIHKEL